MLSFFHSFILSSFLSFFLSVFLSFFLSLLAFFLSLVSFFFLSVFLSFFLSFFASFLHCFLNPFVHSFSFMSFCHSFTHIHIQFPTQVHIKLHIYIVHIHIHIPSIHSSKKNHLRTRHEGLTKWLDFGSSFPPGCVEGSSSLAPGIIPLEDGWDSPSKLCCTTGANREGFL